MTSLVPRAKFKSEPDDNSYYFPGIDLEKRKSSKKDFSELQMSLPDDLCGLTEPTLEEQIAVLRYLALRIARILYMATRPDGLSWYYSYYEDTTLSDYLEVGTAVLASLNASVTSTSPDGSIAMDLDPVEDLEEFFYDHFMPMASYFRVSNPDGDEDFEYDFNDAFVGREALDELYEFIFFFETQQIIDLDRIFASGDEATSGRATVAISRSGSSTLQPARIFDKPLDRIMLTIIGVIQFFKYSSEYGGLYTGGHYVEIDFDELRTDMMEHIEEFPDEEEYAREIFEEQSLGHINDYEFLAEFLVFNDLGIVAIDEDEDGWLHATLTPAANQLEPLFAVGLNPESENCDDPLEEEEPVGLVRLGFYEWYFFTPSDDETAAD